VDPAPYGVNAFTPDRTEAEALRAALGKIETAGGLVEQLLAGGGGGDERSQLQSIKAQIGLISRLVAEALQP
jgi:hypothetical protein